MTNHPNRSRANEGKVFKLRGGWHCIVNGRTFGPWACKEYALAGLAVEKRREAAREMASGQRFYEGQEVEVRYTWAGPCGIGIPDYAWRKAKIVGFEDHGKHGQNDFVVQFPDGSPPAIFGAEHIRPAYFDRDHWNKNVVAEKQLSDTSYFDRQFRSTEDFNEWAEDTDQRWKAETGRD